MLELEIDRKRLNSSENLKFMPFGKSLILMPFGSYAIWEVAIKIRLTFAFRLTKFWKPTENYYSSHLKFMFFLEFIVVFCSFASKCVYFGSHLNSRFVENGARLTYYFFPLFVGTGLYLLMF